MKQTMKLVVTLGVLGFVLSNMVACAKNGGSASNVSGNVSISGSTISSSDTVNGQTMSVVISNLTMMNSASSYNPWGSGGGQGLLNSTVNVNGATNTIQTPVEPFGYSNQNAQPGYIGPYAVYSEAQCMDTACQNVGLILWLSPQQSSQGTQFKQMGMVQNLSNQTVVAAAEQVGYVPPSTLTPQLPTGAVLFSSAPLKLQ